MITVRLEPTEPFNADGEPECWLIVSSRGKEMRRFAHREKALAEAYVTEFNITAYQADRRLRDARRAHHIKVAEDAKAGSDAAD